MIFKTKLLYDSHISKLDDLKIIHPLFSRLKSCPNDFFYQTGASIEVVRCKVLRKLSYIMFKTSKLVHFLTN